MNSKIDLEEKIYTVGNELFNYVEKHPDEVIDFLIKKRIIQTRKIQAIKKDKYLCISINFRIL